MKGNNKYMVFIGLGYEIVVLLLLFTFAGMWADDHWGWKGLGAGGGALLAMALWLFRIFQTLRMIEKNSPKNAGTQESQQKPAMTTLPETNTESAKKKKSQGTKPASAGADDRSETNKLNSTPTNCDSTGKDLGVGKGDDSEEGVDGDGPSKMSH